jgi:hypothetical protein
MEIIEPKDRKEPPHISNERQQNNRSSRETTAIVRNIPREHWDDETVREFVDFLNRAENLQADMAVATSQLMTRFDSHTGFEPHNFRHLPPTLDYQRELLGAPNMSQDLSDRYLACELLLRSAIHILREDIGRGPCADFNGYLKGNLNWALGRYGLKVVDDDSSSQS